MATGPLFGVALLSALLSIPDILRVQPRRGPLKPPPLWWGVHLLSECPLLAESGP